MGTEQQIGSMADPASRHDHPEVFVLLRGQFSLLSYTRVVAEADPLSEPFSSSKLAGLKDVDGLDQLSGLPGAAAEFAQDAPGLELGVGAFAGAAQPGVGAVGGLLRGVCRFKTWIRALSWAFAASRGALVLVDQAAQDVPAQNR
jgi:hypothetical protein